MIIPLSQWLTRTPRMVPLFWQFVGVCLFLQSASPLLDIAVVSWPGFPGHTKGFEIAIVDFLMMAMLLSLNSARQKSPIPFKLPMLLYFASICLSAVISDTPTAALFYVWQLLRMYLFFFVVARCCADDAHALPSLMKGLAIGLLVQCGFVLYQKFGLGYVQTVGTFSHQNLLGLVSNLVVLTVLAAVLARPSSYILLSVPLAGLIIAAFSASRATQGLIVLGFVLVYGGSILFAYTSRKLRFGLMGLVVAVAFVPVALGALDNRLASKGLSDFDIGYDERGAYKEAASLMVSDYPLGVGANQFVLVANVQGYYDRAGVAAVAGSRAGTVHNIYWLTLAEAGYLGLAMFLILHAAAIIKAFRLTWRYRKKDDSNYVFGAGVALLITCLHSNFEWVTIVAVPQYFIAALLAIIAGMSVRLTSRPQTSHVSP